MCVPILKLPVKTEVMVPEEASDKKFIKLLLKSEFEVTELSCRFFVEPGLCVLPSRVVWVCGIARYVVVCVLCLIVWGVELRCVCV